MERFYIPTHSFVDLITNSSSETFVCNSSATFDMINEALHNLISSIGLNSEQELQTMRIETIGLECELKYFTPKQLQDLRRATFCTYNTANELTRNITDEKERDRIEDNFNKWCEKVASRFRKKILEHNCLYEVDPDAIFDWKASEEDQKLGRRLTLIEDLIARYTESHGYNNLKNFKISKHTVVISSVSDNSIRWQVSEAIREIFNPISFHG